MFQPPLGLELGVQKVRGPGTLEPCALPELALPPEAKALKKPLRRKIARIGSGHDSMHRELKKRVLHARPNCLGRIAVTLVCHSQREANLGVAAVGPTGAKANVSDESARCCENHGKLKPSARCPRREPLKARDEPPRLADRKWALPVLVTNHLGITPIGGQGLSIAQGEAADHKVARGEALE